MKIELIKEEKQNKPPWYVIMIDDEYLEGCGQLERAEKRRDEIIANPDILNTKKTVLSSQEIIVTLENETNK